MRIRRLMPEPQEGALEIAELERSIRAADPTAWVVPTRILRRVIKHDRRLTLLGFQVPHGHLYTIAGELLSQIVDPTELGERLPFTWPSRAILIGRPDAKVLSRCARGRILYEYSRMLFHGRVHAILEQKLTSGEISLNEVQERIQAIGTSEFQEISAVLRQDGMILPPGDDSTVYVEFAACYLELLRFAPSLLAHTFPGIDDRRSVEQILSKDIDDQSLLAASRLPGAFDPGVTEDALEAVPLDTPNLVESTGEPEWSTRRASRRLIRRAKAAGSRGNVVRAAILRTQAARRTPAPLDETFRAGGRGEIGALAGRLQRALGLDEGIVNPLWSALCPLLERASRGFWTSEARLLYDLQRVCVDNEREVYKVDLLRWVATLGRQSLRRRQPLLRDVMIANHLRGAARRLRSARLSADERGKLSNLLRPIVERALESLRDRLMGPIDVTLSANGFHPANLPERVAYQKLVEELLDRITERGFFSIGELRDACSRSNLKLPDLAGPREFFRGDRLLLVDHALACALDGIYRRGEVYLRWLARFSALAFATAIGRFLTLYVALPFGGAFVLLEGLQHFVSLIAHHLGAGEVRLMNRTSFLLLGIVALGAVNFLTFRHRFVLAVRAGWRLIRLVLFDTFAGLLRHPLFRLAFASRPARLAWRYVLKPALFALPAWGLARVGGVESRPATVVAAAVFLIANALLNSRVGRDLEEILADSMVRAWNVLVRDYVPGLFRLIMETFDKILESVDRVLYAVDEWLRFRSGESRVSIVGKAILGAIWFVIAYVIRIYVILMIEPQINPIKHFPVVTVSHKIILPLSLEWTRILTVQLMPLGRIAAEFIAWCIVLPLPGVFGFLVWELKENWRLYEANRREGLGKVIVGGHGETLGRLLRPGFHSGTLPKLFAKLRKSERRRLADGKEKGVLKYENSLHHVEESIARFVGREFLALVDQSRTLGPLGIDVLELSVSTNRIRIDFGRDGHPSPLRIVLEERSGKLIACATEPGWLLALTDPQRRVLLTAMAGFYKFGGIEWIREPQRQRDETLSAAARASSEHSLFDFQTVRVTWSRWVEAWEREKNGTGSLPRFVVGVPLLPAPNPPRGKKRRTSRP